MKIKLKFRKQKALFQLNFNEFGEGQFGLFIFEYLVLIFVVFSRFVSAGFLVFVEPFFFLICLNKDKGQKKPIESFVARYIYTGLSNGIVLVLPGLIMTSLLTSFFDLVLGGIISISVKKFILVLWYLVAQLRRMSIHSGVRAQESRASMTKEKNGGLLESLDKIASASAPSASENRKLADQVSDLMMNSDLIKCPKCGKEVKPGMTFCAECGARVQKSFGDGNTCIKCGTTLQGGETFCPRCHHPVGMATKEQRAELEKKKRKPVPLTDRAVVDQTIAALSTAKLELKDSDEKQKRKMAEELEREIAEREEEYRKAKEKAENELNRKREEQQKIADAARKKAQEEYDEARKELELAQKRDEVVSTLASLVPGATMIESEWEKPEVMTEPEVMATPVTSKPEVFVTSPGLTEKTLSSQPPDRFENIPLKKDAYRAPEYSDAVGTATPVYTTQTQPQSDFSVKQGELTKPALTSAPGFGGKTQDRRDASASFEKPTLSPSAAGRSITSNSLSFGGNERKEQVCLACSNLDKESSTCSKDVMPVSDTYCWHQNKS